MKFKDLHMQLNMDNGMMIISLTDELDTARHNSAHHRYLISQLVQV